MARRPRLQIAGLTQHVIHRGNNRSDIFRCTGDYEVFLAILRFAFTRHPVDVHAWVLMTTHFHLLLTPRTAYSLSKAMQIVGRRYVQHHFNWRYTRTGTLFEGRFRSMPIDTDKYFFNCMRYIEQNPVRAGLVTHPEGYRWSSYSANALGMADDLNVPHPLYLALGNSPRDRQRSWRELCAEPLSEGELETTRHAVHHGETLGQGVAESAQA